MTDENSEFKKSSQLLIGQKGGHSTSMAELLAKHKSSFVSLKKGESVKGTITKLTSSEILVDVGAKTEAIVLEKEKRILRNILSLFKVGESVEVNVLNPESDSGQPVVSLRRYLGNIAWKKLEELEKSKEQIDVTIVEITKAGYVANSDFNVTGFLPQSHTTFSQQDITPGARVKVSVLELNRAESKIIFSQKAIVSDDDFKNIMNKYKLRQKVSVKILNITPIGLFVSFPADEKKENTVEGLIHISEIAWENVSDLSELYQAGQVVEAVITRFDSDSKRINLSIKRLSQDPFEKLIADYPIDEKITGKVVKVEEGGVTIALSESLEGFMKKDKIPPGTSYSVDQTVTAVVSEHDKRRHRIILVPVLFEKPIGYR